MPAKSRPGRPTFGGKLLAVWRASQIPDTGPNKARTGTEGIKCQNGAGSTRLSLRTKR